MNARRELLDSPFWHLGVSLDDDMETVEERIEELEDDDPDADFGRIVQSLRNPHERVRWEVAWLPGLDADEADQEVRSALKGGQVAVDRRAALAEANLRILQLEASGAGREDLVEQLLGIAQTWERVDPVAVAQQINAHRSRAGLRAKATENRVRMALEAHRARMNATVREKIVRLPTAEMVAMIQTLSQTATDNGRRRAPGAVREWMKMYERDHEGFFVDQKVVMEKLTKNALTALQRQDTENAGKITKRFCQALETWDSIAQPIQLMYQGEGTTDPETERVFEMARNFSLRLNNEYGETMLAAEVLETQRRVFKEAERLDQRLEQDEDVLAGILREKEEMQEGTGRTPPIDPFYAHIGVAKQYAVEITNERIRFGTKSMHPDKVTGLRWGARSELLGTAYDIWIVGEGLLHISTMRPEVYQQMTERLLAGCGLRIAAEITTKLATGGTEAIGSMLIKDGGVRLTRRRWLKSDEVAWVPWSQIVTGVSDDKMAVWYRQNRRTESSFSLRDDWNGVVVRQLLAIRDGHNHRRLSDWAS